MAPPLERSISQLILPGGKNIELVLGDITDEQTDAIVNAANSALMPGAGVSGAIHGRGGPAIYEECRAILSRQGEIREGQAVMTRGGELPAPYVIHTVGPVWRGGGRDESAKLRSCYRNSIELADERGLGSIAFPAISTGVFGYPLEAAAEIAVKEAARSLEHSKQLSDVRFVLFDPLAFAVFVESARALAKAKSMAFKTYTAD